MSTVERLRKEGEARGELRGRIATLLQLLQRRFGELPASTLLRVEAATLAELELWTDRVLDRPTREAVFAAHRPRPAAKARARASKLGAGDERMSVVKRLQKEGRAQGKV